MQEDEFKNVVDRTNHSYSFKKNVFVPFISGVLGTALVLRNMLWSSYNKRKNYWKTSSKLGKFTKCRNSKY